MGPDILSISVGETWRGFGAVAKASGSAITTGVSYYLECLTGANAGKWWKDSDQTWANSATANAMTHHRDGNWTITLTSSPFLDGILYQENVEESGGLHVSGEGRLLRGTTSSVPQTGDSFANLTHIFTAFELDGAVYRLTSNALEQITIVPLQSALLSQPTFTSNGATINNIEASQNSGPTYIFAITDGDGAAVNLVGKTLWFVVHNDIGDVIFTRKTGGTGVTIGGVSGNQVTVVVTAANLANAGDFEYKLWDKTSGSELPIAVGAYVVKLCPVGS